MDGEEWKDDIDSVELPMSNYYRALRMTMQEMFKDNPAVYLLDDLCPRFRPPQYKMRDWKDDTMNALIQSFRNYRYLMEEDRAMAVFLAYRDSIERQFNDGVWRTSELHRLGIAPGDLEERLRENDDSATDGEDGG